ncbi:hypothetical protein L602_002200000890 [Cupriavidus gilardii J11]|uniref:Uncharacterized protein n=1 Tax=Cupriavidus gilardii J11 TaxID=936133 RepID=A0A562BLF4_9BURK|nr:ferredoxin [Cupriavidus gilardii]TWG86034.1 hypothetical protein L602_002200000890 [Cupriavidus gilardii J11]
MYVILTSRSGEFRTEPGDGMHPVEAYDYVFYGRTTAHFVIASLERDSRVRVIEERPPYVINQVPTKFLEKFDTIEAARAELRQLATFGSMDIALVPAQRLLPDPS